MNLTDGTVRAQAGYTYDTAGRIATGGDGGDTLTYAYTPGTDRAASTAWTTATGNNTAYTYDSYHRLTGIAVNNTPVYGYTLNDKDQRTGATLENGDNWAYTYDTLGQLTGALKKDSQDNTLNSMSYAFDLIGNRTTATEDATNWTYASNLLNQYTQVNALLPTYDADGNMLTWNGWTYTWNGENCLVCAENDDTKVEMSYDYMGRRFEKKVYTKGLLNLYTWTLQKHRKFAYDGYKLVAEFDAMNNDALLANYLWQPVGLDVPLRATIDGDACYFVADGNKNVIELRDAMGVVADDYTYTPFGGVTASGSTDNPFRFSSEYHDDETELVYYNYRYYNPMLGRWINRDPIEEQGGSNLYTMANNNTISRFDILGLWGADIHKTGTIRWLIGLGYKENAANLIGTADENVDNFFEDKSPLPAVGNQGYHFNMSRDGGDSRLSFYKKHFDNAKRECSQYEYWNSKGNLFTHFVSPHAAAVEFGTALHPLQDWIAHGDYGYSIKGGIWSHHNSKSPQRNYGYPGDYPDMPNLDVLNSPDGRASRNFIKFINITTEHYIPNEMGYPGGTYSTTKTYEYAIYTLGTKRYQLTRQKTEQALKEFKSFLKSSRKYIKCKCFFLEN